MRRKALRQSIEPFDHSLIHYQGNGGRFDFGKMEDLGRQPFRVGGRKAVCRNCLIYHKRTCPRFLHNMIGHSKTATTTEVDLASLVHTEDAIDLSLKQPSDSEIRGERPISKHNRARFHPLYQGYGANSFPRSVSQGMARVQHPGLPQWLS